MLSIMVITKIVMNMMLLAAADDDADYDEKYLEWTKSRIEESSALRIRVEATPKTSCTSYSI